MNITWKDPHRHAVQFWIHIFNSIYKKIESIEELKSLL